MGSPEPPTGPQDPPIRKVHPLAIASLLLGLTPVIGVYNLPIVSGLFPYDVLRAVVLVAAILCGSVALHRIRNDPAYFGTAYAVGGISVACVIASLVILFWLTDPFASIPQQDCGYDNQSGEVGNC
jgi:hypothetical protein